EGVIDVEITLCEEGDSPVSIPRARGFGRVQSWYDATEGLEGRDRLGCNRKIADLELQGPVPSLERRNVRFQGVLREVHESVSFSGVVDQPHAPETIALQRSRGPHDGYGVIQSDRKSVV